jgi:flagellin
VCSSDLNVGNYTVVLNYQEAGSNPVGDQTLTVTIASSDARAAVVIKWNNAVAANSSLAGKIEAVSVGAGSIEFRAVNKGAQYSLKFVSESNTATDDMFAWGTARATRGRSLDTLSMTITTANRSGVTTTLDLMTAAAGFKAYTSIDALVTDFNRALGAGSGFGLVAVGSVNNVVASTSGTNKVKMITSDEGSDYKLRVNSNGTATEDAENALGLGTADSIDRSGTDALISFDGYTTPVTSVKYASTSAVTIGNKVTGTTGRGTIDLTINTAANGINTGDLLLNVTAAKYSTRLDGGPATEVTAGMDAIVWNSSRSEYVKVNYALTSDGGSETISNTDASLVFQIGANVGQTAKVGISNMKSTSLGKNIAGNMFTSLSAVDVTSVAGAQDSQRVIDSAISEVSNLRGKLGSFQKNTLESNLSNLRIAAQNLTASESSIRDTDMASEMSTFVRYQILLQAGTAMLAQANQVPQVVLSLFR